VQRALLEALSAPPAARARDLLPGALASAVPGVTRDERELQEALMRAMMERNYETGEGSSEGAVAGGEGDWRAALAAVSAEGSAGSGGAEAGAFPADDELALAIEESRALLNNNGGGAAAAAAAPAAAGEGDQIDEMLSAAVEHSMREQRAHQVARSIALEQGGDDEDELIKRAIAASLDEG
jgi:hypothetical protein